MATVCHTIYSRYEPQEPESLSLETDQSPDVPSPNVDDIWQQEANLASRRRQRPPPRFVPASAEHGPKQASSLHLLNHNNVSLGNELSGWYRSLSTGGGSSDSAVQPARSTVLPSTRSTSSSSSGRAPEGNSQNNWFIRNVIQSEPPSMHPSPPPSLADILARDPPPLPTEEKYRPPVWLELGPDNKGFAMLRRSGWNEGEALGPDVLRRPSELPPLGRNGGRRDSNIIREVIELKSEEHDDVSELREVAVIDLTLSDSESDIDDPDLIAKGPVSEGQIPGKLPHAYVSSSAHGGTALLTPLPTVLKSDRLGIGLKAKTIGPHKASKKRVTHNAAAIAVHTRAAEESRRQKKEHGRGQRGYDKIRKREEAERKRLLAYING